MTLPTIIQGGMGIGVSGWRLANAVSQTGHLGVVSGTALDNVMICRLQGGDPGGHIRRAMAEFPRPEISEKILSSYYRPQGRDVGAPYARAPKLSAQPSELLQELLIVANFVEVFLAKEGHSGPVGINYLEKIQIPLLASAYGALLAGVDYVLMGAGIPREIPGVLDRLSRHEDVDYRLHVEAAASTDNFDIHFSPSQIMGSLDMTLQRPDFLAIIASTVLAQVLAKKAKPPVDGFVIEGPSAGGHNAPPRGGHQLNDRGEPVYGPKDVPDFAKIAEFGLPFWLAGSRGSPEGLQDALANGAAGIQVGTAFAVCEESDMDPAIKDRILRAVAEGGIDVFTNPTASPTGFPFKVARLNGTLSEADRYAARFRVCDLGYLRVPYVKEGGRLSYRCGAEPIDAFVAKGGDIEETLGRICLCNGLMAAIGFPQVRKDGTVEPPVVTLGDDINHVGRFFPGDGSRRFTAADVIRILLGHSS